MLLKVRYWSPLGRNVSSYQEEPKGGFWDTVEYSISDLKELHRQVSFGANLSKQTELVSFLHEFYISVKFHQLEKTLIKYYQ